MPEFERYPKMTRIPKVKMWITEKVDGTNAQILIEALPTPYFPQFHGDTLVYYNAPSGGTSLRELGFHQTTKGWLRVALIGSRKRTIEPNVPKIKDEAGKTVAPAQALDNAGFARWVRDNEAKICELLGEGRHYGEWAGPGINGNRHQFDVRHFFLFGGAPCYELRERGTHLEIGGAIVRPVPLLYEGPLDTRVIEGGMSNLLVEGSQVGSGPPEGIVVSTLGTRIKDTYEAREGKWSEK